MDIIIDILEGAEVLTAAANAYEYIEICEEILEQYSSQIEEMDSKYLDKSIDDLDIIKKELRQLKHTLEEVSASMSDLLESYVSQDEATTV